MAGRPQRWNLKALIVRGVFADTGACIEFLREQSLLARHMQCRCGSHMMIEPTRTHHDGVRWRCPDSECRTTTTVRAGSFFKNSRARLVDLVMLIYFWSMDHSQRAMIHETGLSHQTVKDWCRFMRGICAAEVTRTHRKIGGANHVVSIDETFLAGRRPNTNRQGRPVRNQIWLFGGVDHVTKEVFLEIVPPCGRTAPVMEEMIMRNIADGTTIWSDQFASYRGIEALGKHYRHETVNHSYQYITSSGVHTNFAESLWADVKRKFKRMNGVDRRTLPDYIKEWEWRRRGRLEEHFSRMLQSIARDPRYQLST